MFGIRHRLLAALLLSAGAASASAGDLVVGQVLPLSGVLASTGREVQLGTRIYLEHINDTGGINGAHIRHIVHDDGYKPDETVRLTRQLIDQQGAVALVGFAGTANIGELLKQGTLAHANIALVAPITGADALRTPFTPNVFHLRASYGDETEYMVETLLTIGTSRIGVFYQNDGFGKAGLAGVEKSLAQRGLKVAVAASYERNTDDVAAAVKAVREAEPHAVIMMSVNRSTAAFVKEYRKAGGKAQLLNVSVVDPAELVKLGGAAEMRGLGITQVVPFPYTMTLPVIREFQTLLKKYGPDGAQPTYMAFESFIGAKILVEGLRRAGVNPTPEKVLRALETLDRYDVGGFIVGYSPRNRIGSKFVDMSVMGRDGKLFH